MKHKWFVLLLVLVVTVVAVGLNTSTAYAQSYVHYVVVPGDTLGKIAYRYCTSWKDIYSINRDTIGNNPNVIQPGMALTIPAHCDKGGSTPVSPPPSGVYDRGPINHATGVYRAPYYYIAWGDVISSIGQRFGVPWQDIAAANGVQGTRIYAGQTLLIPTDSSTGTLPPSQTPPERVYFAPGAISDTRQGTINQGVPKSYILTINGGQTLEINTQSHGEPLFVTVANTKGELLPLNGENGKVADNLWVQVPARGDYIVTVAPVTLPESPTLTFDITFVIQ